MSPRMPSLPTLPAPKVPGLVKGLAVTLKTMLTPAVTSQYPHVKPDLPPRTRGVIALMDENCTVCMLCAKECPDWCIYIESHKERLPPAREGGRERTRNTLDRFAIDYALCMYCGICVDVCPFDALFWSPEFEYSTYTIAELTHERGRLRQWMDTVPPPPPLEEGAEAPPEIASALEKVEKQRQAELEARQRAAEQAQEATAGPAAARRGATAVEEEIEVEAEVDQEIYDQLIAEGKSERVARARAKAAYVRREKARIRAEREAQAEAEPSPAEAAATDAVQQDVAPEVQQPEPAVEAPAEAEEIHVEGGEIDQEVYDQLIAEGKGERVARAKAKAAWVRKEKARLRGQREGDGS